MMPFQRNSFQNPEKDIPDLKEIDKHLKGIEEAIANACNFFLNALRKGGQEAIIKC